MHRDRGVGGRVVDYGCRLEFRNGVVVDPGDIVFGEVDGVVLPRDREVEVIQNALEKAHGEELVREAIEAGLSEREAFQRFGVM